MVIENYILLLVLILFFLSGALKGIYHWKYLQNRRPELRKFRNLQEFRKTKNMHIPSDYWDYFDVTNKILLPVFKLDSLNDEENKNSNKTLFFSYLSILLFVLLILIATI